MLDKPGNLRDVLFDLINRVSFVNEYNTWNEVRHQMLDFVVKDLFALANLKEMEEFKIEWSVKDERDS